MITTHLTEVLKDNMAELLSYAETQKLLDDLRRDWLAFVDYNQTFAAAIADLAADGAKVLVQDYHLDLVPAALRTLRPDLRIGHFTHTPWASSEDFSRLPADVAQALLLGVLGADSVGFHSPRWAADFAACAADVLGTTYDEGVLTTAGRRVPLRVHPLGVDAEPLLARAAEHDVKRRVDGLNALTRGQQVVARVDRTEPAKNIHRGLIAFAQLLRRSPGAPRPGGACRARVSEPAGRRGVPRLHRRLHRLGGRDQCRAVNSGLDTRGVQRPR